MTIRLDEQARTVIARRAAGGRDTAIRVRIIALRGCQWMLQVPWGRRCPSRAPAMERVDGVDVALPGRVARYARWRDLTVTACHLGPFTWLAILDEPLVTLELARWQLAHPRAMGDPAPASITESGCSDRGQP